MKTRQKILEDLKFSTSKDKTGTIKSVIKKINFMYYSLGNKTYQFRYLNDRTYSCYFSEESLLIKIATHV